MSKKYNAIDLFCGCGGFSHGFIQAGFNVLLGIDNDKAAIESFMFNHKNAKSICGDITQIGYKKDIKPLIGNQTVDIVIGGPPCQGMSLSGFRKLDDPRNKLYLSYIRLVNEIRPKAFVIENVPGLVGLFKGAIKDSIIDTFNELGYTVKFKVISAADYGVPQKRNRVVFVGVKGDVNNYQFPLPFGYEVTCEQALSDLPPLVDKIGEAEQRYFLEAQNDFQKSMRKNSETVLNHIAAAHSDAVKSTIAHVPDGGNYKDLPEEYRNTRKFNVAWTRFSKDRPSPTIDTGHRHHFHYKYNRVPTVRECARLQSFSDDFVFFGNKTEQFRQVGNAVPPLMSKAVAGSLKDYLEGSSYIMYETPKEYDVRLHHVRPRFKDDIENVLIYVATEISKIPELPKQEFAQKVNAAIYRYTGNSQATQKTIDNWRTEISALFGFIEHNGGYDKCGLRAKELAEKGDLIECFKTFLFSFQYPAAHLKPQSVLELIEKGVRFKPAQYILKLLKYASEVEKSRPYITKIELCHCIFNDLRVIRDNDKPQTTWKRIIDNRNDDIKYSSSGDVIRYAGDIADYMVIANILVTYDNKRYYLNTLEDEAIHKFINSNEWFSGYDTMIKNSTGTLQEVREISDDWFKYVNRPLEKTDFTTDIIALLADDSIERTEAENESRKAFAELVKSDVDISTKDIGDFGESLIFAHECERLRQGNREDLVHLVKRIPTALAMGYDINSRELDDRQRHIEVKTTVSSKPLDFNKVHLTRNEWNAAETDRSIYFVYRLMINKTVPRLFILQDPVSKYKQDLIIMVPTQGADLTFTSDNEAVGFTEELLSWTK